MISRLAALPSTEPTPARLPVAGGAAAVGAAEGTGGPRSSPRSSS